jgi:hypothetical protein
VRSIVIPAANTGKLKTNKKLVINTLQTNSGTRCICIPGARMFITVVIKFIELKILLIPLKCRLKIAKSTEPPGIPTSDDNGG